MKIPFASTFTCALARSSAGSLLVAFGVLAGCGHDQRPAAEPTTSSTTITTTTTTTLGPASPGKVNSTIYLSEAFRKECGISSIESVKEAPKFKFDESAVTPDDRDVLAQVAQCLTTGALKGKTVKLIGRADARGTQEYNMALGERRASSVMKYLGALGVGQSQMKDTSRGALDATGSGPGDWQKDRRVDIDVQP